MKQREWNRNVSPNQNKMKTAEITQPKLIFLFLKNPTIRNKKKTWRDEKNINRN